MTFLKYLRNTTAAVALLGHLAASGQAMAQTATRQEPGNDATAHCRDLITPYEENLLRLNALKEKEPDSCPPEASTECLGAVRMGYLIGEFCTRGPGPDPGCTSNINTLLNRSCTTAEIASVEACSAVLHQIETLTAENMALSRQAAREDCADFFHNPLKLPSGGAVQSPTSTPDPEPVR